VFQTAAAAIIGAGPGPEYIPAELISDGNAANSIMEPDSLQVP
jgi:hypothetical protein